MSEKIEALRREFVDALARWDTVHPEDRRLAVQKDTAARALLAALAEEEKPFTYQETIRTRKGAIEVLEPEPSQHPWTHKCEKCGSGCACVGGDPRFKGICSHECKPKEPTRSVEGKQKRDLEQVIKEIAYLAGWALQSEQDTRLEEALHLYRAERKQHQGEG